MTIVRVPLLTDHELQGAFRYRDLFQLLPPRPDDPRPPVLAAAYGLTLEVDYDHRVVPERNDDVFAHDVAERERVKSMRKKAAGRPDQEIEESWWDADKESRAMRRGQAVVQEIALLLSVLTNHHFRAAPAAQLWVLNESKTGVEWRQPGYPSFVPGPTDTLSQVAEQAPTVPHEEYYARGRGRYVDRPELEVPESLTESLDRYFALPEPRRLGFARAVRLIGHGSDVLPLSRSLSLAAAVIEVDTLVHLDDPELETCPECSALLSDESCDRCGAPRFRLTSRFREFVDALLGDAELASHLYRARSDLVHRGVPLRSDEYDSGFSIGENDSQFGLEFGAVAAARAVLLNWLWSQS